MLIELSPHKKLIQTLCLGNFPKNVVDLEHSHTLFEQIAFVDYQLQVLIQQEFNGRSLSRASPTNCDDATTAQIALLIAFLRTSSSNYGSGNRTYEEDLYCAVVLAHLYHLNSEPDKVTGTLTAISVDNRAGDFAYYLKARYYMLLGSAAHNSGECWSRFLVELRLAGSKSLVAANLWTAKIMRAVLLHLSGNGANPVRFLELLAQEFSDNAAAFVAVCNYAMKPECERFILKECRAEYVVFLAELIQRKQKQQMDFPDATHSNSHEIDFVESLFTTLNGISDHKAVVNHFLAPKLAKKFLLGMLEHSFQSTVVLLNYIRTLIDLLEYDEALAAFKTYCHYVKIELAQHGAVDNLLEVVEVYSMCIAHFNPARAIASDATADTKKFRYNSTHSVMEILEPASQSLRQYLDTITDLAELQYDRAIPEYAANQLAFLYHRYNPSMVLGDKSALAHILSAAWHSLGQLVSYSATHASPTDERMKTSVSQALMYYKNALIVNSTGSVRYLTSYALALAYSNAVKPASKLCKFILKRYPESFRTWNLLVLLTSATEQEIALYDESPTQHPQFFENGDPKPKLVDCERFSRDALNVAAMFIAQNREKGVALDLETKHEILQLKMTHIAVVEAKHGPEAALEQIVDVFTLFRELFDGVKLDDTIITATSNRDARWSHRPSVMDPHEAKQVPREKSSIKGHLRASRNSVESRRSYKQAPVQILRTKNHGPAAAKSEELRILQRLCLWASSLYHKLGFLDEAEQCIVEAETVAAPNVETYTSLGLLTSKSRKFLSLQEFERCFELFNTPAETFNKSGYCATLLGMCKLFIVDDEKDNSLFVSNKDLRAGLIRLKNYLENFSTCYPYGYNSPELWYYLSSIYETFDDKQLNASALWRCVELERNRPVRSYHVCEEIS